MTRLPLSFTDKEIILIKIMDILSNFASIEDLDRVAFRKYMRDAVQYYDDDTMSSVITAVSYRKSTIAFFKDILDSYGIPNNLADYLSALSKYKIPEWR